MISEPVQCPTCQGTDVIKHGQTADGKRRFRCPEVSCPRVTFIRDYSELGRLPETKQQIIDRAVNGSGVRDTARVLRVSTATVIKELKTRVNP